MKKFYKHTKENISKIIEIINPELKEETSCHTILNVSKLKQKTWLNIYQTLLNLKFLKKEREQEQEQERGKNIPLENIENKVKIENLIFYNLIENYFTDLLQTVKNMTDFF